MGIIPTTLLLYEKYDYNNKYYKCLVFNSRVVLLQSF